MKKGLALCICVLKSDPELSIILFVAGDRQKTFPLDRIGRIYHQTLGLRGITPDACKDDPEDRDTGGFSLQSE